MFIVLIVYDTDLVFTSHIVLQCCSHQAQRAHMGRLCRRRHVWHDDDSFFSLLPNGSVVVVDCFHHYSIFPYPCPSLIAYYYPHRVRSPSHFRRLHLWHSDLFHSMCHTIWGSTSRKMIIAICFSYSNGFYLIKGTLVYGSSCLLRCSLFGVRCHFHSDSDTQTSRLLRLSGCIFPRMFPILLIRLIKELPSLTRSPPQNPRRPALAFTHRQKKIRLSENVNWDGARAQKKSAIRRKCWMKLC